MKIFSAEENFLLINGNTSKKIMEIGHHIEERITPCSTFKIALSLMGFDAGILKDENNPVWQFQEGYDDYLESWKNHQTPQSWMKLPQQANQMVKMNLDGLLDGSKREMSIFLLPIIFETLRSIFRKESQG